MADRFDTLLDEFLDDLFEDHPIFASSVGVDGYYDKLGDHSAEGFIRREDKADAWQKRFGETNDETLTEDERLDRDLVVSAMRGSQITRDWEVWRRNPDSYLSPGLSGAFSLFLHRLLPEPDLVDAATARLTQIPGVIADGLKNLDPKRVSPLFVKRALGQCRAGVNYFRSLIPAEVEEGPLREKLGAAGEVAARSFEEFAAFLEELEKKATGHWALGEERYGQLLREREMLGYGAREMLERGKQAFDDLDREMKDFAKEHFRDSNWRAVMAELNKEGFASHDEMRDYYEEWTERAREFLITRGLVTLPEGERCLVEPSPPFQRPILAVASYSTPPAFKPSLVGHFFVPYPPAGSSAEEARKRLEGTGRHGIPTTSVHEAYPGHHWHLTAAQSNPRKVRQVLRSSYFTEGWALYAEKMMREQGFFADPKQELAHLGARIFRAARIVVDVSLHIGDMTYDDAKEYLSGARTGGEATIDAEVGRYCSWPTQAPSYLTGSLEIERMRESYLAKGKSLREFHDTIARTGAMPIGLAERALSSV